MKGVSLSGRGKAAKNGGTKIANSGWAVYIVKKKTPRVAGMTILNRLQSATGV